MSHYAPLTETTMFAGYYPPTDLDPRHLSSTCSYSSPYSYTPYKSMNPPGASNSELAFDFFSYPPMHDFSPSPSDTSSSSSSTDASPSPQSYPRSVHVVCNAPLVAPIPLPYHSPTFLQFELPDPDQDLSHPPYTRRAPKRKRATDEAMDEYTMSKRRGVIGSNCEPHPHRRVTSYPNLRHQSSVSGKRPRLHCHT